MPKETYLGDGLYVADSGFEVTLRAPREGGDHYVVLDPYVLDAFIEFLERSRNLKFEITKLPKEEPSKGESHGNDDIPY